MILPGTPRRRAALDRKPDEIHRVVHLCSQPTAVVSFREAANLKCLSLLLASHHFFGITTSSRTPLNASNRRNVNSV